MKTLKLKTVKQIRVATRVLKIISIIVAVASILMILGSVGHNDYVTLYGIEETKEQEAQTWIRVIYSGLMGAFTGGAAIVLYQFESFLGLAIKTREERARKRKLAKHSL